MGQDLIQAAAIRSQISQIERYNTAVRTFQEKYNYLPGDIADPYATQFGFKARGSLPGQGDGNGKISSWYGGAACNACLPFGETGLFWVDLSQVNLIGDGLKTATATGFTTISGAAVATYLPSAKIGNGNYMYVYESGVPSGPASSTGTGIHYIGISIVTQFGSDSACADCIYSATGITVQQAYNLDKKVDDGLPQSGAVLAQYMNTVPYQAQMWAGQSNQSTRSPYTTATAPSTTTCFDNGNVTGATQQYSLQQNNGTGVNCALSFKLQ